MKKLTVKDLLDLKGKRPLTQVNVHKDSEARACQNSDAVSVCMIFGQVSVSRQRFRMPSVRPVSSSVMTP